MYDKERGCVRGRDLEDEEDIVFNISGKKIPGVWMSREAHKKLVEALAELVEKVEALLLNGVICLGRHAKSEWSQCPSCVAEYNIKAATIKVKAVLQKN